MCSKTYTPIALIRFGPNGNTVTIKVFLSEAWEQLFPRLGRVRDSALRAGRALAPEGPPRFHRDFSAGSRGRPGSMTHPGSLLVLGISGVRPLKNIFLRSDSCEHTKAKTDTKFKVCAGKEVT